MFLSDYNTYQADEHPKSEFKKGDHVFDSYDNELIVEKVSFQPVTRVFMYQFEGQGFACSAYKMRKKLEDKPYSMGDVVQLNRELDNIMDEIISSNKDKITINGTRAITGEYCMEFFQPDNTFIKWLKEYANGRVIVEVGCGGARLLYDLQHAGAKIIGIEPSFNPDKLNEFNREQIMGERPMVQILCKNVEDCKSIIQGAGDKILILIARPSHGHFVENTLDMKDKETEMLFITLPENIEKYNDLGFYNDQKVLVKHEGYSVEGEVVYSIKS